MLQFIFMMSLKMQPPVSTTLYGPNQPKNLYGCTCLYGITRVLDKRKEILEDEDQEILPDQKKVLDK